MDKDCIDCFFSSLEECTEELDEKALFCVVLDDWIGLDGVCDYFEERSITE